MISPRNVARTRIVLTAMMALATVTTVLAADYSFTRVYAATNTPLIFGGSLNDAGTVAFALPDIGVYSGNGGPLTTIADTSAIEISYTGGEDNFEIRTPYQNFQDPVINNSGIVYFHAQGRYGGVFYGGGGPFATHWQGGSDANWAGRNIALNNVGGVVFYGSGGSYQFNSLPFPNLGFGLAINDANTVIGQDNSRVLLYNNGAISTVADQSQFGSFPDGPAAINNTGWLLYGAQKIGSDLTSDSQVYDQLTLVIGGVSTQIAEVAGTHFYGAPVLNDQGVIAFETIGSGHRAIYSGKDLDFDRLIQTGDSLDGSQVVGLRLFTTGLNESGQLAFSATLADGRTGVYIASPVPEPATVVLLLAGAVIVAVARARRY